MHFFSNGMRSPKANVNTRNAIFLRSGKGVAYTQDAALNSVTWLLKA